MSANPTPEQIAKLPKWAQEYLHDMRRDAAIAVALRWTSDVSRDVPIPEGSELSKGWDFSCSLSHQRVFKACSSCVHHGEGWERTSSQHPRRLFSTKLNALRAMRHTLELEAAKALAKIDMQIQEEQWT